MYFQQLADRLAKHPNIRAWRLTWHEGRSMGIGIRDNEVGNVYGPPSYADGRGGSYLVQWDDERLSRGNVDGNTLVHFDDIVAAARQAAYDDPDAANFLGPQTYPTLETYAPETATLISEGADRLLAVLSAILDPQQAYEIRTVNGNVSGSEGRGGVITSAGLEVETQSTGFGYSYGYDGQVYDGFGQRAPYSLAEIEGQIARTCLYLPPLRQEVELGDNGVRPVLLHPRVVSSFLGQFVWANLSGSQVFHEQSAFRKADFAERKQVFRDDIRLVVDPLQPMRAGTFTFTSAGLPARRQVYVEDGCLQSPTLGLKYARRLGLPATTPPGGRETVEFSDGDPLQYDEALVAAEGGVLILSMLGMHTQDSSRADYSLSVPQGLLIRGGRPAGRVKVEINGNFFANLRDPALRFVRFPAQPGLGAIFPCNVTTGGR